jgi:hypothetical protein
MENQKPVSAEQSEAPGLHPGSFIVIRMDLRVELDYEIAPPSADFIFNIQVARTPVRPSLPKA